MAGESFADLIRELNNLGKELAEIDKSVNEAVNNSLSNVDKTLNNIAITTSSTSSEIIRGVENSLDYVKNAVGGFIDSAGAQLNSFLNTVNTWIDSASKSISGSLELLKENVEDKTKDILSRINGTLSWFGSVVSENLENAWNTLKMTAENLGAQIQLSLSLVQEKLVEFRNWVIGGAEWSWDETVKGFNHIKQELETNINITLNEVEKWFDKTYKQLEASINGFMETLQNLDFEQLVKGITSIPGALNDLLKAFTEFDSDKMVELFTEIVKAQKKIARERLKDLIS